MNDEAYDDTEDINSPNYHAPNKCHNKKCWHPNCVIDDSPHEDDYGDSNVWWKLH